MEHKQDFTQTVASFVDPEGLADAVSYQAVVGWGDGSMCAGTLVANGQDGYDVVASGNLTWGWHDARVTITDLRSGNAGTESPRSLTLNSAVYCIAPAIAGVGAPPITPVAGHVFSGAVASYVGLDVDLLDRYSASVSWGDGQWSHGTLVKAADGSVQVAASHTYVKPGLYDISVQVGEMMPANPWTNGPIGVICFDTLATPANLVGPYLPGSSAGIARTRAVVSAGTLDGNLLPINVRVGDSFSGAVRPASRVPTRPMASRITAR